jgi:EmrB/QacA subfamily drug resistance transporter
MCAALALVIAAGSSLALALPELARSTGASQTEQTWVVNVYALVFAALLLPLGIAADRFGRRGALVLGLAVFGACSVASGLVTDPAPLIVLRALAGAGAAAVMPATLSVLVDAYPEQRRASAIGVWAAVSGAGALLGLLLAGVLLEFAWWGSVQVTFGAASAVVLVLCLLIVPTSRNPGLHLDPAGGVLALLGLAGVVFGVIEGPERGWTDRLTLAALVAGALTLALFVRHELRSPYPMLDVRLFRNAGLSAGSAVVFLQFFAAFGLFFLGPQWLQYVHRLSALQAALWLTPMALGIGPTAQAGPALLRRFGARNVAAWGMGQMAVALALLARQADGGAPLWQFAAALFVFGVGFGLALTPGTALVLDGLPSDRRTLASAVNDVTREVGGALGGAVAASVLLAVYGDHLRPVITGLPAPAATAAHSGVAQAIGVASELGPAGASIAEGARNAFGSGYGAAMLLGAGVLLSGAVVCGLLAPPTAGRQEPAARPEKGRQSNPAAAGTRPAVRVTAAHRPVVGLARTSTMVTPSRRLPRKAEAAVTGAVVFGIFAGVGLLAQSVHNAAGGGQTCGVSAAHVHRSGESGDSRC